MTKFSTQDITQSGARLAHIKCECGKSVRFVVPLKEAQEKQCECGRTIKVGKHNDNVSQHQKPKDWKEKPNQKDKKKK